MYGIIRFILVESHEVDSPLAIPGISISNFKMVITLGRGMSSIFTCHTIFYFLSNENFSSMLPYAIKSWKPCFQIFTRMGESFCFFHWLRELYDCKALVYL